MAGDVVVLNGRSLTPGLLRRIADGAHVSIDDACRPVMAAGRAIVEEYFARGIPAYGLTTGLGMKATEQLTAEQAVDFSYRTVRGRAQGLGPPLAARDVRAVIAVRLNTMLNGAAGASPHVAEHLVEVLARGVVPVMRSIGSLGNGDLVAMAALPHSLIGEGELLIDGEIVPAAEGLTRLGVEPLRLAPKDGTMLCNTTAMSAALAALAVERAEHLIDAVQIAGALSMEAFVANLSPLHPAVLRLRPQPGQIEAGAEVRSLLIDGPLGVPGAARRLQDPTSLRCIAQVHGMARHSVGGLRQAVDVELNSTADNPAVIIDEGICVSVGNFHLPHLAHCTDGLARAMAWVAMDSVSRVQRLMHGPFTGLPPLLASPAADHAGFGPILKPLEALRAEIIHLANPVPILGSHNADGVEDSVTFSALAATKLHQLEALFAMVVAIELIVAAQAIDLRGATPAAGRPLRRIYDAVRAQCGFIDDDRPLAGSIDALGRLADDGRLGALVGWQRD